jgi:hypothetical protein
MSGGDDPRVSNGRLPCSIQTRGKPVAKPATSVGFCVIWRQCSTLKPGNSTKGGETAAKKGSNRVQADGGIAWREITDALSNMVSQNHIIPKSLGKNESIQTVVISLYYFLMRSLGNETKTTIRNFGPGIYFLAVIGSRCPGEPTEKCGLYRL